MDRKVLIIDDEKTLCDSLSTYLKLKGYDVMATTNTYALCPQFQYIW